MIKYSLKCVSDLDGCNHEFEAWFRSSADFDSQRAGGLLECPICGGDQVEKAIMAPAVARKGEKAPQRSAERLAEIQASLGEAMAKAKDYVEKNFDYVGSKFPEEARRIHYGEVKERNIYGEATISEAKELVEEGVNVAPLPVPPSVDRAGKPVVDGTARALPADKKKQN